MHLTCWRRRRGHTTLGAETGRRDEGKEGEKCRDMCACAVQEGSFSTRNKGERDGGRE